MIAPLGRWIARLTCGAMLAALAEGMMPEGPVRRVGRLACALMLVVVMLQPITGSHFVGADDFARRLGQGAERQRQQLALQSGQAAKAFIEERLSAYISDKAAQRGMSCRVRVECAAGSDGAWLPDRAVIVDPPETSQRAALTELIESELAVPPDRQSFAGGE